MKATEPTPLHPSLPGEGEGSEDCDGKGTPVSVLQDPKRNELKGASSASKPHCDPRRGHMPQETPVALSSLACVGSLKASCTRLSHAPATGGLTRRALCSSGELFPFLRDEAVIPLLNFVTGSRKEDVRTQTCSEAWTGKDVLHAPLGPKPTSRPRSAGGRAPHPNIAHPRPYLSREQGPGRKPQGLRQAPGGGETFRDPARPLGTGFLSLFSILEFPRCRR